MNQGVVEEQRKALGGGATSPSTSKDKQKKWLFRRTSGTGKDAPASPNGEEEVEGMRVDFYRAMRTARELAPGAQVVNVGPGEMVARMLARFGGGW